MAAPQWYISRGGQRVGPLDAAQLKQMAGNGQLQPTDHVWREGMAEWASAKQVKGLFPSSLFPADAAPSTGTPGTPGTPGAPSASATPAPVSVPQTSRPGQGSLPATDWTVRDQGDLAALAGAGSRSHRSPRATPNLLAPKSKPLDAVVPMVMAGLMLATLFIPWHYASSSHIDPIASRYVSSGVTFSWHLIDGNSKFAVWSIATWVCALAAMILAPLLKGIPRGLALTAVGLVAAVFLMVYLSDQPRSFRDVKALRVLDTITSILLLLMMIASHVRLRGGPNTFIRIVQIVTGGAATILIVVQIIIQLADSDSPFRQMNRMKDPWNVLCQITIMLTFVGTLTSAALALIHGCAKGLHTATLSAASVTLMYVTQVTSLVLLGLFTAAAVEQFGSLLAIANMGFIIFGGLLILIAGLVQLIDGLRRVDWSARAGPAESAGAVAAAAPAASAPATPTDLDAKFVRLEALRKAGHITEEEFQRKREALLGEI